MSSNNLSRDVIIYIVKMVAIQNALSLGWNIKQINDKQFEFSKNLSDFKYIDLKSFINNIVPDTSTLNFI